MHLSRRNKTKIPKTSFSNMKTVEVGRGRNGYGFTMNGQYPCILSSILPGSPADVAGLKSGDCVMAVNGENVTRVGHEQIIKLIGTTSGVLRLTVACLDESESSDDDYIPAPRVRFMRSKSTTPSVADRDEGNKDHMKQGTIHEHLEVETPTGINPSSKFAPGHLSPYNQTGKATIKLQKPASSYDYTFWNGRGFEKMTSFQKPRKVKRHAESRQRQRAHSVQNHTNFYDEDDEADQGLRPLTPVEVSNIRYPSLYPNSKQSSQHTKSADSAKEHQVVMSAIVGYLGSIDIPASANLPTASLQAIRGCVRRLHLEQRVHSVMLMEITNTGVELINANRKVTVVYHSDSITFSGICPDDKRCFGIVTAHSQGEVSDCVDSDDEPVGSSCHVFLVDPSLSYHNVHFQMAARFGIECVHDAATNTCQQFPMSSRPLLTHIAGLHSGHGDRLHFADFYGQSAYPAGPRRSNSNSSNSDSGFGNGKETSTESNQHGERVMIVDVAGHIRKQRTREQYNAMAISESSSRYVAHAEINPSQSSYSLSSMSPSSPEQSPKNTLSQSKIHAFDPSGRLTPRARPDPILKDRNGSVTPLARPSATVHDTSSGRLTPRVRPDPVGFCSPVIMQVSKQENGKQSVHVKMHPSITNQYVRQATSTCNMHTEPRSKTTDVGSVKGRPPTGRHSMYAKLDASQGRSMKPLHPNKKAEIQRMSQLPLKMQRQYDLIRRNSDCSEYSSSNLKMSKQNLQQASQFNMQLKQPGTRQSLAASDGELDTAEGDSAMKSEGNQSNPNLLDLANNQEIGRVSSWAVSFDHLLQDELGLACFTEFLKREFSEENIMFWIACETMSKMTKKEELKRMSEHIYSKHLSDEASMPVNLDSSCRSKVLQAIKNPCPDMFKIQQQQIFQLMKYDSYTRFLKSQVYQDCVLAEMAGNPLPGFCRQRSDGSVSSTEEATGDNKRAQKGNKKKYQLWKSSKSYGVDATADSPEKKRKSLLPWNKGKALTKPNSGLEPSTVCTSDSGPLRLSHSHPSANSGNLMNKTAPVTSRASQNEEAIPMEGTCRLVFPNDDVVVLPARHGFTVRDVLTPHLDVRQLSLQSVETFLADSKEIVDYQQDMATMAGAEIVIEQRVVFKMELPSHRVIGVKSKPTKKLIEVLRPVTHKYNLQLDELVVHLNSSPVPLDLDITVASLDGQKILIETLEQYGAGNYQVRARVDPAPNGTMHRAASEDSIIRKQDARRTHQPVHLPRRLSQNEFSGKENQRDSGRTSVPDIKCQAVTLRPSNSDTSVQTVKSQNRKYRITNNDAEELYSMLSKAQRRRMDDQRGLTIRNLDLPDFLKKPNKNTKNRSQSALGTPYQSDKGDFLQIHEKSKQFKDMAVRCKSTPPTPYNEDLGLGEGIIPSHIQAEAIFGSRGRSSDITPISFNESMMATGNARHDYDDNLDLVDCGFGYHGVTHNNLQTDMNDEKCSPFTYLTDSSVAAGGDVGARDLSYSTELNDRSLGYNYLRAQHHGRHLQGNQHRDEGYRGEEYDLDQTLTKSTSERETFLPPLPDGQLNHTLNLDEANYSPPPPLMSQDKVMSLGQSGNIQGSTLPGHASDMSNQPLTDTDSVNFGDSSLSDDALSPRLPSPSTHDLVMTPYPEEDFDSDSRGHGFHHQDNFPHTLRESEPSVSSRPDVLRSLFGPENINASVLDFSQQNSSQHLASQQSSSTDDLVFCDTSQPRITHSASAYQDSSNSLQQNYSQNIASRSMAVENSARQDVATDNIASQNVLAKNDIISGNMEPKQGISLQWKAANGVQHQRINRDKWETVVKDGRTMRATFV
ncbi:regulator of G-protein signaling 12-like isoform X2 [Acanthaster planci]|uniref:Regulator of G-protein signaling 12-like isoform X2 n=1 Tax=Acanthaster planci TaxID=133434 RepID=A0A8B7ZY54_ACAPL|nr:regulator of G-protein signaling 12-like isoform X2 [Acanthaster planci]